MSDRPSRPERYVFLLLPGVALLAFSSALAPLSAANWISGKTLYEWRIVSLDGQPVQATYDVVLSVQGSTSDCESADVVVVCTSGVDGYQFEDPTMLAWLRRMERRGARIGAIADGAFVLARAGLLESGRCTLHWRSVTAFRERYPNLIVSQELFEISSTRFTCAGGTAALDLMLSLIKDRHGASLCSKIAENFLLNRIRDHSEAQRMPVEMAIGVHSRPLVGAIAAMRLNLEQPLSGRELASVHGISERQLERLFRRHLGCTLQRYYLGLRLERATSLLRQTTMPLIDIAIACGFSSLSYFSKCYRRYNGVPPSKDRSGAVVDPTGRNRPPIRHPHTFHP